MYLIVSVSCCCFFKPEKIIAIELHVHFRGSILIVFCSERGDILICHEKGWWFGVHNNPRSIEVCSGLRDPQLRIRPTPCGISGVRAKVILYILF